MTAQFIAAPHVVPTHVAAAADKPLLMRSFHAPDAAAAIAEIRAIAAAVCQSAARDPQLASRLKDARTSRDVEEVLFPYFAWQQFVPAPRDLFSGTAAARFKGDGFRALDGRAGILLEVERGMAFDNERCLRDLWKVAAALLVDHLFLVVPKLYTTPSGGPQAHFARACQQLGCDTVAAGLIPAVKTLTVFGY